MAELRPLPFHLLVRRAFEELDREGSIFGLPRRRFFMGDPAFDLSIPFHDRRAGAPLGPAAGPHTQMAQNIVLSWLAGGRVMELKTVQVLDQLDIPRPCIDMATVGFNVEWSQELRISQSLREYVKAAMLIHMLEHKAGLRPAPHHRQVIYDMSVGYDLKGIRSEAVQQFIRTMRDAGEVIEELRRGLPRDLRPLADLDVPTELSNSLTLSTFHGCPPDEIEGIVHHILVDHHLPCIVKLNPTLLGKERLGHLLHEVLGYREIHVPDAAFDEDLHWDRAVPMLRRLQGLAAERGLGFGIKLTNTLVVENHRSFFPPSERVMYLSGPPLHVLSMQLLAQVREVFGGGLHVSFSAGVDRRNYPDAVALGLRPVTVCSDLLKPGGYGRLMPYSTHLIERMERLGVRDLMAYTLLAMGEAQGALDDLAGTFDDEERRRAARLLEARGDLDELPDDLLQAWLAAARRRNARAYADRLLEEPRYRQPANRKPPRKIDSHLHLFDCLTCDKCIPVCPNHANFAFEFPFGELPGGRLVPGPEGRIELRPEAPLAITRKHQIGTFADFCNECGNCDVFCPELGGPYIEKPRFFGTVEDFQRFAGPQGFHLQRRPGRDLVLARIEGLDYRLERSADQVVFETPQGRLTWRAGDLEAGTAPEGRLEGELDLRPYYIMDRLRAALLDRNQLTYVAALAREDLRPAAGGATPPR